MRLFLLHEKFFSKTFRKKSLALLRAGTLTCSTTLSNPSIGALAKLRQKSYKVFIPRYTKNTYQCCECGICQNCSTTDREDHLGQQKAIFDDVLVVEKSGPNTIDHLPPGNSTKKLYCRTEILYLH